jgi:hypothetical protein
MEIKMEIDQLKIDDLKDCLNKLIRETGNWRIAHEAALPCHLMMQDYRIIERNETQRSRHHESVKKIASLESGVAALTVEMEINVKRAYQANEGRVDLICEGVKKELGVIEFWKSHYEQIVKAVVKVKELPKEPIFAPYVSRSC